MSWTWPSGVGEAFEDPAGRIVDVQVDDTHMDGERVGVVTLRFTAEDLRGDEYVATAKLYLPAALLDCGDPLPMWFNCGYELPDVHVPRQLRRGRLVVTSVEPQGTEVFPHANPLCRGPNTDYVLLHLVRGASFVDPTRIILGGGSAGGYACLLAAAETFPVPVAVANVPVVNLVYEGAYFLSNGPRIAANPPVEYPLMGLLMAGFTQLANDGWGRGFGLDVSATGWYEHSPVAHLDRITAPVATCFSTADFLVPIEQVSASHAAAVLAGLPDGVVMAAAELTAEPRATDRLVDLLGGAAEVRVAAVPAGAVESRMDQLDLTMSTPQAPLPVPASTSGGQQWLVVIVDEGPTVMGIGHTRHGFEPDFDPFIDHHLTAGIGLEQLSEPKLIQLLNRWSAVEWLAPGFCHLDRPAAERADVERGLRTYCATSREHAANFARLYDQLPDGRRVLPIDLVTSLTAGRRTGGTTP